MIFLSVKETLNIIQLNFKFNSTLHEKMQEIFPETVVIFDKINGCETTNLLII